MNKKKKKKLRNKTKYNLYLDRRDFFFHSSRVQMRRPFNIVLFVRAYILYRYNNNNIIIPSEKTQPKRSK